MAPISPNSDRESYEVHGIKRRASLSTPSGSIISTKTLTGPIQSFSALRRSFRQPGLTRIICEVQARRVYNLGAQSHVAVSFDAPEYTADVNGLGTFRLLEAIRFLGLEKKTRFYRLQLPSFWARSGNPQRETTPFYPRSPYAVAKLFSHWITINYREAYGLYACNGFLFNHEGPRRGETFVTRKITRGLAMSPKDWKTVSFLAIWTLFGTGGMRATMSVMQWLMLQQAPLRFCDRHWAAVYGTPIHPGLRRRLGSRFGFEGAGVNEVEMSVR